MTLVFSDDVFAPDHFSGRKVEAVQNARPAKRHHFAAGDARRGSRPFAGDGAEITGLVGMAPEHFAGEQLVADDPFFVAALFQCYGAVADDGEARPRCADRPAPKFLWRLRRPIARQPGALRQSRVAIRSQELWVAVR